MERRPDVADGHPGPHPVLSPTDGVTDEGAGSTTSLPRGVVPLLGAAALVVCAAADS